jgi:hypothetical protein
LYLNCGRIGRLAWQGDSADYKSAIRQGETLRYGLLRSGFQTQFSWFKSAPFFKTNCHNDVKSKGVDEPRVSVLECGGPPPLLGRESSDPVSMECDSGRWMAAEFWDA